MRAIEHPVVQRILANMRRAGVRATEVYTLAAEGSAPEVHFDVFSMREWAEQNCRPVKMTIDWARVRKLVDEGSIDGQYLLDHITSESRRPIIVGQHGAGEGRDQILDGSHTYVEAALEAASNGLEGKRVLIDAYYLQRDQWQPFIIPQSVMDALNSQDLSRKIA